MTDWPMAAAAVEWDRLASIATAFYPSTGPRWRCPTPWKHGLPSRYAALLQFVDLLTADPTLDLYLCRCGTWHAGHPRGRGRARRPDKPLRDTIGSQLSAEQVTALRDLLT